MATRMQQRRGTASQWTAANPILAAGEIGFETDTNQFKIGDGVNAWADLSFFKNLENLDVEGFIADSEKGQPNGVATLTANGNIPISQLGALIDGAPDALNTLKEIGDFAQVTSNAVNSHNSSTTDVHGIPDTSVLTTATDLSSAIATEVTDRNTAITALSDSVALDITAAISTAGTYTDNQIADEVTNRNTAVGQAITDHSDVTTNVHGIGDTSLLATQEYADNAADAAELAATTAAGTAADTKVSDHNLDTTNVHGISDTSVLVVQSTIDALTTADITEDASNKYFTDARALTAVEAAIATAKSEAIADATSQVTAVIASAPAALDTLNEIAAALGDDENFAATMTSNLAAKVDSYSTIQNKTASYTLSALTEKDNVIEIASSSASTLTIPADSTVDYPVGTTIDVIQTSTGQITVAGAGGVTVNATPGLKLRTQWSSATLLKRAANTWIVYGDLMA